MKRWLFLQDKALLAMIEALTEGVERHKNEEWLHAQESAEHA